MEGVRLDVALNTTALPCPALSLSLSLARSRSSSRSLCFRPSLEQASSARLAQLCCPFPPSLPPSLLFSSSLLFFPLPSLSARPSTVCLTFVRVHLDGFTDKAPVSKAILGVVGASSLLASVLEWKPWLPLDLERVLENGQVWRLATHHLAFRTSGELFIGGFVLYSLRLFERRYGTAKFAAFAAVTSVLATLFQVALLTLGRSLGYTVRAAAPGPYVGRTRSVGRVDGLGTHRVTGGAGMRGG